MKLDIRFTPCGRKNLIPILHTLRVIFSEPNDHVEHRRIKGTDWIMIDAPEHPGDNVTLIYRTNGFRHYRSGVER